ncbi:DNA-binding protein [Paenibacillus sp. NPDC058910]|uniref:DNA-binding protein n=1 Tax=unclassified Paenibacillus TaxID=185978 RepID=UPI0036AF3B84
MRDKTSAPAEESDFPVKAGKPARRALIAAGYHQLADLTQASEKELLALHGVGPKAIRILREALAEKGLSFKE